MHREIKYGNDLFREIISPESKKTFKVTYWDLWIAILLNDQFSNDLNKLIDNLNSNKTSYLSSNYEALSNHIYLLHQSLLEEKLYTSDILVGVDDNFIKKQKVKANKKILKMGFKPKEKSIWMINTPKKLRNDQAMRGHWHSFPTNPNEYANLLEGVYKSSGFYSEGQSFKLEDKLSKYLDKYKVRASFSELFALYRAFLTVVVEKMDMVDDSYGVIGDLYGEVFKKYFLLDRSKLDMEPLNFFLDFIELIIWEDYGCTDNYQPEFFNSLTSTEASLVESILLQQRNELNNLELKYQAKNALTMLKILYKKNNCNNFNKS